MVIKLVTDNSNYIRHYRAFLTTNIPYALTPEHVHKTKIVRIQD